MVKNRRVDFWARINSALSAMSDFSDPMNTTELQMPSGMPCEEMICLGKDTSPLSEGRYKQDKLSAEREVPRDVYVCTHCGEKSTSPRQTWLGFLGCFGVIGAFFVGGFLGMIHPLLGIALFILIIVSSIVNLVRGGKTYCEKCGKYDTMISAISPQGVRLLREFGHVDDSPKIENIQPSVTERLEQVRKLLDGGLISEAEYEAQRRRILDSL